MAKKRLIDQVIEDFVPPTLEEEVSRVVAELSPEEYDAAERLALAALSQEDSPRGFAAFYRLIHGTALPKHAREWIDVIYDARKNGRGVVIQAFRGSTKTTTLTVTFAAFRIGHEPHKANLLIQCGDDNAKDNAAQVADIIANTSAWKLCFPAIVPDVERGWGAGGYEVKRGDIDYAQWRELCSQRKDPTFLGCGYKSSEIIGKHPTGLLLVDDLHDERNSSSERELSTVRDTLTGTILPTVVTGVTWEIFVGTPWVPTDALQYLIGTGEYVRHDTPVLVNGESVWPDVFTKEVIEKKRRVSGKIQFARMFLLDLTAAKNRVFHYQTYPNHEIRYGWPIAGGLDYAGVADEHRLRSGKTDYFALCYTAKLPGGGAVVVDGVLDRCTQVQSELYVKRAQEMYGDHWLVCVVEGDGKGEEFYQVIRRNPKLRLLPLKTGGRGKQKRLEREMSPWLEAGQVRISDADTPFLNELRRELDEYPLCEHDDALDAMYWSLRAIPDVLFVPVDEELPQVERVKKVANPFMAWGSR